MLPFKLALFPDSSGVLLNSTAYEGGSEVELFYHKAEAGGKHSSFVDGVKCMSMGYIPAIVCLAR